MEKIKVLCHKGDIRQRSSRLDNRLHHFVSELPRHTGGGHVSLLKNFLQSRNICSRGDLRSYLGELFLKLFQRLWIGIHHGNFEILEKILHDYLSYQASSYLNNLQHKSPPINVVYISLPA